MEIFELYSQSKMVENTIPSAFNFNNSYLPILAAHFFDTVMLHNGLLSLTKVYCIISFLYFTVILDWFEINTKVLSITDRVKCGSKIRHTCKLRVKSSLIRT